MKEFWDERFAQNEFVYGQEPNRFFKTEIDFLAEIGKALFPMEGEGRNACYAATIGWDVDAFDYSNAGKEKALRLCESKATSISYTLSKIEDYDFGEEQYDLIVLIFAHLHPSVRKTIHRKIVKALKPSGKIILEAFHPKQLSESYPSGGPKNMEMLYTLDLLKDDFKELSSSQGEELEIELTEGEYHKGKGFVTRFVGSK
jgi:hypothetical protein